MPSYPSPRSRLSPLAVAVIAARDLPVSEKKSRPRLAASDRPTSPRAGEGLLDAGRLEGRGAHARRDRWRPSCAPVNQRPPQEQATSHSQPSQPVVVASSVHDSCPYEVVSSSRRSFLSRLSDRTIVRAYTLSSPLLPSNIPCVPYTSSCKCPHGAGFTNVRYSAEPSRSPFRRGRT